MVLTGDLVTPRLNSRPPQNPDAVTVAFFEKPILIYWLGAAAQKVFGLNRLAARLPAACAALAATLLVAFVGTRWFGLRSGLLAGVVYATAPLTILDARQMTTDGLLVLWQAGALFTFAFCVNSNFRLRIPAFPFLFWIFSALAVLTKGAVGLLHPALIVTVFALLDGRAKKAAVLPTLWQTWRGLRPFAGIALFLLLAAPWHILAARTGERDAQGRDFVQEYIVRQHINRFKGGANGDKVHAAPPFMYILYFGVGFFPWAFFAPAAFRKSNYSEHKETETGPTEEEATKDTAQPRRFLLAWFWTIFVFFSISAAKLPTYIAPAYPPAALLAGRWLDRMLEVSGERRMHRGALGAAFSGGILFLVALVGPHYLPPKIAVPADALFLLKILTLILFAGSLTAWLFFYFGGDSAPARRAGIGTLVAMMLAVVGVGTTFGYDFAMREGFGPYQRLAEQANGYAAQGQPIVYYDIVPRLPSMLYRADYAPREFGRAPLLPYLRTFLTPTQPAAIVLLSQKTMDAKLQTELAAAADFRFQVLARDGHISGGWVMLRVEKIFK